jgi:hypothetical protein
MWTSIFDCPFGDSRCVVRCPDGRACFVLPLQIDVRAPLGRMTIPITIVDARGRETRTTATIDVRPSLDRDGDGMPDAWEDFYELSFRPDGGPDDDPNGDGVRNLDEFRRGTNPRMRYTRYFAEASTGDRAPGVEECFQVAALQHEFAYAQYTLIGDGGRRLQTVYGVGDYATTLCHLDRRAHPADRVVAAIIESPIPFTVERVALTPDPTAVPFGTPAMDAPSSRWIFADGGTDGVMDTFYLAYNPNDAPVEAALTYRLPSGVVARRRTVVLPPGVRTTTWVNADDAPLGRAEAWVEITPPPRSWSSGPGGSTRPAGRSRSSTRHPAPTTRPRAGSSPRWMARRPTTRRLRSPTRRPVRPCST